MCNHPQSGMENRRDSKETGRGHCLRAEWWIVVERYTGTVPVPGWRVEWEMVQVWLSRLKRRDKNGMWMVWMVDDGGCIMLHGAAAPRPRAQGTLRTFKGTFVLGQKLVEGLLVSSVTRGFCISVFNFFSLFKSCNVPLFKCCLGVMSQRKIGCCWTLLVMVVDINCLRLSYM